MTSYPMGTSTPEHPNPLLCRPKTELYIVAGDLFDKKVGRVMNAALSYASHGDGSATNITNVHEVSEELKQSLINARRAAQRFTGKSFERNTILEFREPYQTIKGRSWELILTLGMISLLTQVPLRERLTGSGVVDEHGNITPIGGLKQKIGAAKAAGLKTFLVSQEQESEEPIDYSGIDIIPVKTIKEAFCIATGLAPWMIAK